MDPRTTNSAPKQHGRTCNAFINNLCKAGDNCRFSHISPHVGERWRCEVCYKCFVSKWGYTTHKRIHDKNRETYPCPTCERRFVNKSDMRKHMKRHRGRKFKCLVPHCESAFKSEYELKVHSTRVHGTSNVPKAKQGSLPTTACSSVRDAPIPVQPPPSLSHDFPPTCAACLEQFGFGAGAGGPTTSCSTHVRMMSAKSKTTPTISHLPWSGDPQFQCDIMEHPHGGSLYQQPPTHFLPPSMSASYRPSFDLPADQEQASKKKSDQLEIQRLKRTSPLLPHSTKDNRFGGGGAFAGSTTTASSSSSSTTTAAVVDHLPNFPASVNASSGGTATETPVSPTGGDAAVIGCGDRGEVCRPCSQTSTPIHLPTTATAPVAIGGGSKGGNRSKKNKEEESAARVLKQLSEKGGSTITVTRAEPLT